MDLTYIITQIRDNIICSQYIGEDCISLHVNDSDSLTGNIYIGRVENVVKNINSAFVEIENKIKCYYKLENNNNIFLCEKNNTAVNIGDKMLVQVVNDAHKTKPPTASGKIEISGRYVVISSDVKGVSISKKAKGSKVCSEAAVNIKDYLFDSIREFNTSIGYDKRFSFGIIIRSNAMNVDMPDIIGEAKELIDSYVKLLKTAFYGKFYTKLYSKEPDYINELAHLAADNNVKVITDIPSCYDLLAEKFGNIANVSLRLYEDELLPLYKLYSVEKNLNLATSKKVWLKSGGYLVIEQTEAMCVIDVNSGKNISKPKRNADKEKMVLKLNIEAADEIFKQVRLRNISGIIIIDFVNMSDENNINELLTHMKRTAKTEVIQTNIVDMTPLGLVEMTRKNNGKTLTECLYANKNAGME